MASRVLSLVGLIVVAHCLASTAQAQSAMSEDDLRRYGFGDRMTRAIDESRTHEMPRRAPPEGAIPAPVVPATTVSDRDIPDVPSQGPSRLIQQAGRQYNPPYEGPTRHYRGRDAKEAEGTFKEIENFFFRPGMEYGRFLSMSEQNVTGLIQMFTGEVERKGTTYLRVGVGHTRFRRSFGQALTDQQRLEQIGVPIGAMWVPSKDLEISETLTLFDEQSVNFPIVPDYSLTGIRDVTTTAKYRFVDNPEDRISLAFLFGIKVGVESTVTRVGSNGVDFLMGAALTKRLHNFGLHLNGAWLFSNGQDRTNNRVPDVGMAALGVDWQTGENLDWIIEFNYTDFQNIGHRLDVTPGVKWKISDKWRFDLGFPIAMSDALAQGYYYRITSAFQLRF